MQFLLWLCQATFFTWQVSSFSIILMGAQRGKGKLQRSLDNSIQESRKTANPAQELTGVTLPEEGNDCNYYRNETISSYHSNLWQFMPFFDK